MTNPYRGKPATSFWRGSVAAPEPTDVDPVLDPGFLLARTDRVATAGSCFAQHIARTLAAQGFGYMVTETEPAFAFSENQNYGTFSARYGNIYTVRQLLQLFKRAYAVFEPAVDFWQREDGRFIDPFRPQIQDGGFASVEDLRTDREAHLAAVRTIFEDCDVFIFTLGLTEGWISNVDGAVYPLAPGVVAPSVDRSSYHFHNFTVQEMEADLKTFIACLRGVNPAVRVILTVSPVPLIATYEAQHVLTATTYSKAALRVVAEQIVTSSEGDVAYFPSYEMITGAHTRGQFFAEDLREVLPEGVAYVMRTFSRHYLASDEHSVPHQPSKAPKASKAKASKAKASKASKASKGPSREALAAQAKVHDALAHIICDEESIEANL